LLKSVSEHHANNFTDDAEGESFTV